MPAWTTISNALVAVGAKPFATTVQALRDNPSAIAEGATGAPRVLGKALGSTFLEGGTTSGTTPARFDNLGAMETIKIEGVGNIASGSSIQLRFSNDNGATWGSYQVLVTNPTGAVAGVTYFIYVNIRTGAHFTMGLFNATAANGSTGLTVPTNCNAIEVGGSGNLTGAAVAWCLGGLEA